MTGDCGALTFHHVGIACAAIDDETPHYEALGFAREGEDFVDPAQRVRGRFLVQGAFRIALLAPTAPDSPLHSYLKAGRQMYHQAFRAAEFARAIAALERQGGRVVAGPVPAVAFGGAEICFVMLRNRALIELIDAPVR